MLARRGEDNSTCWVVKPKTAAWKGTSSDDDDDGWSRW